MGVWGKRDKQEGTGQTFGSDKPLAGQVGTFTFTTGSAINKTN